MTNIFRILLGSVALVGFVLSLAVHILALSGVDIDSKFHGIWTLHFGLFVVFIPFVFLSRRDFGSQPSLLTIAAELPRWVSVVAALIFVYAIANFLIFIAGTEGGSATIRDGKYLLLDHGRLIRELTAAEYSKFQANAVRGFSGHWLVFYFVPAAYFLGKKSNNSFKPKPLRGSA